MGGNKPQVIITINQRDLKDRVGHGTWLGSDTPVSVQTVRRIACDAQIAYVWRHVRPGDLHGADRARTFDGKLRRQLEISDGGCAFPGRDRPPSWCTGHHIHHRADGGPTTLHNGVLLCGHHHRLIHHDHWHVHINPHDQIPEFTPPEWIDHLRRPIRNTRLQT